MKKIILDCDPGMDDSIAIIMAAKSPDIKLLAVTTVNGNYPVSVTSQNALKALELIGRFEIPVAQGMGMPLTRTPPVDPFTHGVDGQADANLPPPTMSLNPSHAVDLIIDLCNKNPGEVTLVLTGPMTNLAAAMRKAPEIVGQIREVVAISGMFGLNEYAFMNATGDTPQSEWNVYVDPEAAKIVYESGVKLTAIGLDVATHFEVNFSDDDILKLTKSERPEARFLHNAIQFVVKRGFDAYTTVIDGMAIAYVIDNSIVDTMPAYVGVETNDGLTLGMTVMDRRHHHVWEHLSVINVAYKADYERYLKLVIDSMICP